MTGRISQEWKALKAGDEKAYRQLFEVHYIRMVAIAYRILKDQQEARDCAQDVLIKMYEKRDSLSEPVSMAAYLNKATYHTALNKQQSLRLHPATTEIPEIPTEDQPLIETAEEEARIWKEINQLPDQCRRIFLLNRFEGLSNQEIADRLQLSKRTVETQISLALKKLRKSLLALFFMG